MDTVTRSRSSARRVQGPQRSSLIPRGRGAGALRSAIHRVLTTDEIVRYIMAFLVSPTYMFYNMGRGGLSSLAALAATCSALSEPALEILWRQLDNFEPVGLLWDIVRSAQGPKTVAPVYSQRLMKYASYVREIVIHSGDVPEPFLALSPQAIFPSLRRLHWVLESEAKIQHFAQFAVPGLRSLCIDLYSSDVDDISLFYRMETRPVEDPLLVNTLIDGLRAAQAARTTLDSLEIFWLNAPSFSRSPDFLNLLMPFKHLKTLALELQIIAGTPRALEMLSTLPHLAHLTLQNRGKFDMVSSRLQFHPARSGFDALRSLSLHLSPCHVYSILSNFPKRSLENCTTRFIGGATEPAQRAITELVMTKLVGRTTQFLSLDFQDGDDADLHSERGLFASVSPSILPLLCTRDLVQVEIGCVDPEAITDRMCSEFAKAWPQLRVLNLRPQPSWTEDVKENLLSSMVTLRALRIFAEGCPHLSYLNITLNAVGNHWANEAQHLRQIHSRQPVTLSLGESQITHPDAVAMYLSRCFSPIPVLDYGTYVAPLGRYVGHRSRASIGWERVSALLLAGSRGRN
ncbi:hypothetical protein C8Q80DRAFT_426078 [Daedaleopsis nitida]|nr:hypothetical protein C8Q80DRAFT_426078 [Daedaleopsis nitida]